MTPRPCDRNHAVNMSTAELWQEYLFLCSQCCLSATWSLRHKDPKVVYNSTSK